ncbi:replication endonuclease [Laribacter hongkongensis]|uniref:replication endonuclease n=1 Tax=Laribacter hongkongensis TaxID=168471 RepID=UPI001EFD3ACC|nr:replication endonuclease [Laribacter hongkongensis]MCG9106328.1 replication endonuclease [Laribacter hongkongensis]
MIATRHATADPVRQQTWRMDAAYRAKMLAGMPEGLHRAWSHACERTFFNPAMPQGEARRRANIGLRRRSQHARKVASKLPLVVDHDQIDGKAREVARAARLQLSRAGRHFDADASWEAVEQMAEQLELPLPEVDDVRVTALGLLHRVTDDRFWLRRVRVASARRREQLERAFGCVHKKSGVYVSHDNMVWSRGRKRRNSDLMAMTRMVSSAGDDVPMEQVVAASVANPAIRRNELMARIAGVERLSQDAGHRAVFLTLTAPSAFHARLHSGRRNPAWNGSNVREAQKWLSKQWARVRACFSRKGLGVYGLRIAEPHHDGTPHWHVLVFGPQPQLDDAVEATLRYWRKDYAEELTTEAARRARALAKPIDPARGSASGYVVKYVCKNVDGAGVLDGDFESGLDAAVSAERVRAWASVWGIRQFQFFGTPSVTLWREARRAREQRTGTAIDAVIEAADAGQWDLFTKAMESHPAELVKNTTVNDFGELGEKIVGIVDPATGVVLTTHDKVWRMVRAPVIPGRDDGRPDAADSRAWTGVNNCTVPKKLLRSSRGKGQDGPQQAVPAHQIVRDVKLTAGRPGRKMNRSTGMKKPFISTWRARHE